MRRKFQIPFVDMAQAQMRGRSPWTSHSRPSIELQHSLPSQVAAISLSVELVMRFISKFRKLDGSEANIEVALHEALANAVVHGNREDPNKYVHVACCCSIDGEVSITIRDQGLGFDTGALQDPTAAENLLSAHGRGIYLMQAFMDEVCFEEGGVVVRMRKKPNACSTSPERSE
jgi:serine/threonine-protein kinase RsbW